MDEIIHYCDKCGRRIPDQDWVNRSATLAEGGRAICSACIQLPLETGAAKIRKSECLPTAPSHKREHLSTAPPPPATRRSSRVLPAQRQPTRKPLVLLLLASGLTVAAAAIAVTLLLILPGSDETIDQTTLDTDTIPAEGPDERPPVATTDPDGTSVEPPVELTDEERFGRRLAAEELAGLRASWEKEQDDPEGFYFRLWHMMKRYKGTPAAEEAGRWWTTLGVPDEFSAQVDWHQAWATETDGPRMKFHDEWRENHFILETHPPSIGEPIRLTRTLHVPDDKPFLTCPVRGHDEGDCEVWVEVNGKPSLHHTVGAGTWLPLAVDLTDAKGQDVEVTIVNQATGWLNEYAYWQMPRFVEHAPAGSATAALLQSDVAQRPREVPGTADVEEPDVEERVANWDRALDLLATVDPKRDTFTGQWKLVDGALECGRTSPARLVFPYRPAEEYDVRITFTVKEHQQAVTLLLSYGDKNFACTMGAWENTICGFGLVDGKKPNDNPTTVKKGSFFQLGKRYTMTAQVRDSGLKVYLDGKLISQLATGYGNVTSDPDWKPDAGRQLWLGLGTWDTRVVFHSAQVAEVSGKGKSQILPTGLLASDLPGSERAVMARWLEELSGLLQRQRYQEARERLRRLTSDPPSPTAKSALAQDAALLDLGEKLLKNAQQGFAQLTDGRSFELWTAKDQPLLVGADHPNRVLTVKDGVIEFEMRAGAGKVTRPLGLDHFSLRSQVDTALLALGEDGAAPAKRVLGTVLRYRAGADAPSVDEIRGAIDALAKDRTNGPLASRLRAWLEQAQRERQAKADYEAFKTVAMARLPDELKRATDAFEKKHRETAMYAEILPELRKLGAGRGGGPVHKRGLWAMYYSGDAHNKFRRLHGSRVETRSAIDWKTKSPMSGVPADYFGIRFRGALNVPKGGTYLFNIAADDELKMSLDGRQVCSFTGNKNIQFAMRLSAGEHSLKIDYAEHGGSAKLVLRWRPPGAKGYSNIPASALTHRPSAIEGYGKR